jgi:hypothetical protein
MAIILQAGTVIQYKNSAGAERPGTLLQLHNPLTNSWDLIAWGSTGIPGFHSGVTLDQTQTTNGTFAVVSDTIPF